MDNSREARRSSSTSMAASNGVTKRRQRFSESSGGQEVRDRAEKKERDPESVNRSKRRRSERYVRRNERDGEEEEDCSDESMGEDDDVKHRYQRKSLPSSRIADGMIGVPVPRKARSACIKRSHDCRTSSGSGGGGFGEDRRGGPPTSPGFEVASPSPSVKQKKVLRSLQNVNGPKSRIPKPPKSSGTMEMEDDLEIEIAEVLSGLKQQHPHRSKIQDDSEVKDAKTNLKTEGADDSSQGCKANMEAEHSANIDKSTNGRTSLVPDIHKEKEVRQETPSLLDGILDKQSQDSTASKGVLEGPQLENYRDESNCASKLESDLMVPPTLLSSPERLTILPFASDSGAAKDCCKQDSSVKSKEKIIVEKHECLNLDLERLSQDTTGRNSSLGLQNLGWTQPQQSKFAQQSSVSPLTVAVGGLPSGLPHQGYVPLMMQKCNKPVDGESYTCVQGASFSACQPRPKRCATHFFIARNIQLHQHFVKSNHLPQPNKDSVYLKGGDLRPTAGNPSLVGSPPILSLNSQAQDRSVVKASESGHFASTRQKKTQPPSASSSIVPSQAFIFPTNHHLQPIILPSKSSRPTNNNPCMAVDTSSVNFNHPSSSACEASSPYFTVLPNNAYSFQLSSTIRDGNPSQALPFFNGSFYSPQMFQPPELLQKQSKGQWETKATSCSSSSYRQLQLQPQVRVNSVSSQANVQKHRQQSQKSEAKAAGDNSDSRGSHTHKGGPYGQIMTAPMQPQNFSMSFSSLAGGSAPANLNFSTNGYQYVSAAPVAHQKNHQASDSKTRGGSCSSHAEDPKKTLTGRPPAMKGQTLVFDNPSRTLNFVSGTWPPPAATTMSGDPTHHLTQRQQQSGRSKTVTHSQADSVTAKSSQWKNPASSSLTSCNSLNLKQFQSQQQIRTHGQTQISFEAPSKSQNGRSGGGSSSAVIGSAPHGKAANTKVNNSKALPLSPVPSSAGHAQDQAENSASGSTQKNSPVCGRNVPPIITSCPGQLKY